MKKLTGKNPPKVYTPQMGECVGVTNRRAGIAVMRRKNHVYNQAVARNQARRDKQVCPTCGLPLEKREVGWMQGNDLLAPQPILRYLCPKHGEPLVVEL